jgi:hypothetical protein
VVQTLGAAAFEGLQHPPDERKPNVPVLMEFAAAMVGKLSALTKEQLTEIIRRVFVIQLRLTNGHKFKSSQWEGCIYSLFMIF